MCIKHLKMDELIYHPSIRVKRRNIQWIRDHVEIIHNLFSIRVSHAIKRDELDSEFINIPLELKEGCNENLSDVIEKVQNYVDILCKEEREPEESSLGGEDSSYDSDFEGEESKSHQDVSRTVSDTLAAEFAEYVSSSVFNSVSYTAKVEFGLKLGYTEKLVQAALCKLGPNPSQNELLAELIKLGAQTPKLADFEAEDVTEDVAIEDSGNRLRAIVIDGSNVAMSHGNKEVFSCRGIKICVDWFKSRGHKEITVFIPKWRKEASRPDNPITDQEILTELERERIVVFTPSRLVGGKRTICYDDRYVLRLAVELDGIVVSNDNYRDLAQESAEFRKVVEERTLMYSFVNDRFMPPDDPLGRSGPTLENFLKIQVKKSDAAPPCPYGKKCTYGNKCKYHHPERGSMPHKSVSERLVEHAQKHWQARGNKDCGAIHLKGKSLSVPLNVDDQTKQVGVLRKTPLTRTRSGVPCFPVPSHDSESGRVTEKSRSVENMLNERALVHGSQAPNSYRRPVNLADWQFGRILKQNASDSVAGQCLSDTETSQSETSGNLHKKLERQLTLNPYEHPLLDVGGGYVRQMQLGRPYWGHQNVTRIASAPDSSRPVPPASSVQRQSHRLTSTSDSHINLSVGAPSTVSDTFETRSWLTGAPPVLYPHTTIGVPPLTPQPHLNHPHFDSYAKEEARRKLHYHLSSIFPEEQVLAALQLYPNETEPQEICAAILSMFPKL